MSENQSEKITAYQSPGAKLALALSKAQSKFEVPKKTKHVDYQPERGPRVKYSYADLADVIAAVQPALSANELATLHQLVYEGDMYGLKTLLIHSSGEFVETWYPLPDPKKENIRAQAFGSALTYARRYSLSSLLGIAADEDDDGQGAPTTEPPKGKQQAQSRPPQQAAPKHNNQPAKKQPPPQPEEPSQDDADLDHYLGPSPTKLDELYAFVESNGIPPEDVKNCISLACGVVKKSTDLSADEIDRVMSYLSKMILGSNEGEAGQ